MDCIIVFAGFSKSGKTTLAKALATSLNIPLASFGDCVRKEAHRRGFANASRRQLQDLGLEMVKRDVKAFCQAVLEDGGFVSGHGLVIDGIRHMDALAAVKALLAGQPVKLVYLETSAMDRAKRSSLTTPELQEIDSHPVECEVALLKSAADLVLNTSMDSQESFEKLLKWTVQHCT